MTLRSTARPPGSPTRSVMLAPRVGRGAASSWTGTDMVARPLRVGDVPSPRSRRSRPRPVSSSRPTAKPSRPLMAGARRRLDDDLARDVEARRPARRRDSAPRRRSRPAGPARSAGVFERQRHLEPLGHVVLDQEARLADGGALRVGVGGDAPGAGAWRRAGAAARRPARRGPGPRPGRGGTRRRPAASTTRVSGRPAIAAPLASRRSAVTNTVSPER